MDSNALNKIEHVVVLMLENRSFDNLLGWLYDPSNPAPFNRQPPPNFEGIYGKNLSNPSAGGAVPAGKTHQPAAPNPDPGEPYEDVYAQVYGQQTVLKLNEVPPHPPVACNMQGFVYNYSLQPGVQNPGAIMNCFTPVTVPVLSSLAHYYGVCDHWFSSIPTETLCNRSFLHAGTSSGYVDNEGGDGILFVNDTPSIFNLISSSSSGRSWKIYCAGWIITSLALLTQKQLWDYALRPGYFFHLDDFIASAQKPGGLPSYSFIEPNYLDSLWWGPENDMHPESHLFELYGPSNIEEGEQLLYKIYTALRSSPDWAKTLLIIIFDEHGGCYDHVCPPTSKECNFALSPDGVVIPQNQPGGSGFNFDRLGVRVPAVIVSPYTPEGTILNTPFDHTSVLTTVVQCLGLPQGRLGKRQAAAPGVAAALTLTEPRTDNPPISKPAALEVALEQRTEAVARLLGHTKAKPLSPLQKAIVRGAAHRLGRDSDYQAEISRTKAALEADALLMKLEAELLSQRVLH
jgi:phospholipase C